MPPPADRVAGPEDPDVPAAGRRGRLKVFLGYAARSAESFRMYDEGRRRRERGQDITVAALPGQITPDVQETLGRLEIIPPLSIRQDGRDYAVIDCETLFRREPAICLVDDLATGNPPGSRHAQRWEDVQELLDRGISVLTAVNVQEIRELQDRVERITGKRDPGSVPEEFLRKADEIEVVDAPPDAWLDVPDAVAPDARRQAELRELALLLAADVVERQLQEYLDSHGVVAGWGAQERILVCLTPRSSAEEMLRSGQRNAARFHGALLAAYVEQDDLNPGDRQQLEAHLALAREVGAVVHCLKHGNFVEAILGFAREQRVTQLFVGHSLHDRGWLRRGPIDRLIDGAQSFDVRLFPHPGV